MKKILKLIKDLYLKNKEVANYIFFGVCTTAVNIVCYWLLTLISLGTVAATSIAWFISVLFAYITNRLFVFSSRKKGLYGVLRESVQFFAGRIATGLVDLAIMLIFVDLLLYNGLLIKVLSNILVIVLNYIISKFYVFKEKETEEKKSFPSLCASFFEKATGKCVSAFALFLVFTLFLCVVIDKKISKNFFANYLQKSNATLIIYSVLTVAAALGIVYLIKKYSAKKLEKWSNKSFVLLISLCFCLVFNVQMLISANIWFKTGWDVGVIVSTAEYLLESGENCLYSTYFSQYPNNLVITYTVTGLLRLGKYLFPNPYTMVLLANAFIVCLSVYLASLCVLKLTKSKAATLVSMGLGIPLVAFSPWILIPYTDTIGALFPILAVFFYIYIDSRKAKYLLITLTSIVGYFYKPTVIIVLIALVILDACRLLSSLIRGGKLNKKNCAAVLTYSLIGFLLASAFQLHVNTLDRTEYNEDMEFTYTHYLMMGVNTEGEGIYSQEDVDFSNSMPNKEERQKENLRVFKERLGEMGWSGAFELLIKKNLANYNNGLFGWSQEGSFYAQMNGNTNELAEELREIYYYNLNGTAEENQRHLEFADSRQVIWFAVLILTAFTFLGEKSDAEKLIAISLIGVSIFLLLFECRSRYLFLFLPLFLVQAGVGFMKALSLIDKIKENFIRKKAAEKADCDAEC